MFFSIRSNDPWQTKSNTSKIIRCVCLMFNCFIVFNFVLVPIYCREMNISISFCSIVFSRRRQEFPNTQRNDYETWSHLSVMIQYTSSGTFRNRTGLFPFRVKSDHPQLPPPPLRKCVMGAGTQMICQRWGEGRTQSGERSSKAAVGRFETIRRRFWYRARGSLDFVLFFVFVFVWFSFFSIICWISFFLFERSRLGDTISSWYV